MHVILSNSTVYESVFSFIVMQLWFATFHKHTCVRTHWPQTALCRWDMFTYTDSHTDVLSKLHKKTHMHTHTHIEGNLYRHVFHHKMHREYLVAEDDKYQKKKKKKGKKKESYCFFSFSHDRSQWLGHTPKLLSIVRTETEGSLAGRDFVSLSLSLHPSHHHHSRLTYLHTLPDAATACLAITFRSHFSSQACTVRLILEKMKTRFFTIHLFCEVRGGGRSKFQMAPCTTQTLPFHILLNNNQQK